LLDIYQIAIVTELSEKHIEVFINYFEQHDIQFDSVYRDIRDNENMREAINICNRIKTNENSRKCNNEKPFLDYSQIIKDFMIPLNKLQETVLVISSSNIEINISNINKDINLLR